LKKLLAYFAFLTVLVAGILLWLEYKEQKNIDHKQMEERKKELEDLGKKEQAQERLQLQQEREQEKKILEDRKKRRDWVTGHSSSPSSFQFATPGAVSPTPAPPSSPHRTTVESACRSARCTLVQYQEQGSSSYVVVQGPDHNSVSDILVELRRSGMKDFTDHKDKFGVQYKNGQRIYSAEYTIKW